MKAGLVGAGLCDVLLDKSIDYIGVDGGIETLFAQGITPKVVVGDFDSLTNTNWLEDLEQIRLPMHKDDTDTAIAIEYLIKNGYNDITLYGVTGGRLDHFMAVLCLLKKYRDHHLTIVDSQNKIYLLTKGTYQIKKENYQYISFFAVSQSIMTIKGCEYPLVDYLLDQRDPLCVSNEICDNECTITTSADLIVIQSNNKGGFKWQQKDQNVQKCVHKLVKSLNQKQKRKN